MHHAKRSVSDDDDIPALSSPRGSGPFIRASFPTWRATGFELVSRARCAGRNRGPVEGPRRDAPAPVSAGHSVSGEGIYPIIHDNDTKKRHYSHKTHE